MVSWDRTWKKPNREGAKWETMCFDAFAIRAYAPRGIWKLAVTGWGLLGGSALALRRFGGAHDCQKLTYSLPAVEIEQEIAHFILLVAGLKLFPIDSQFGGKLLQLLQAVIGQEILTNDGAW